MAWTLTDPGIRLIVQFEGYTPYAYNDPIGICTAGPGIVQHRGGCTSADYSHWGSRSNPGISRPRYYEMLDNYTRGTLDFLHDHITVPVTQAIINALVSFVHNIGQGGFLDSTVLRELNRRHYKEAARAMLMWVKAGGRTLEGLVRRRKAEMAMFLRGVVKPVRFTDAEQTLMRRFSNELDTAHVVSPRELRLRDRLHTQAVLIRKAANREKAGWEKHDRRRRYQGLVNLLHRD